MMMAQLAGGKGREERVVVGREDGVRAEGATGRAAVEQRRREEPAHEGG